jgi:diguanylate cyclase (GGDEF)-like protein
MSFLGFVTVWLSKKRLVAVLTLLSVACLFWFTRSATPVLRVGYNHFPPYVDADSTGKPIGFAVEILAMAAEKANVRLKWVYIPGSAEDAWKKNTIDVYPFLTITTARERAVHLSPAWWEDELALVSLQSNGVRSAPDTRGKRVATRLGYVQALSANLFPGARLIVLPAPRKVVGALCSGAADAFFVDARVLMSELLEGREDSCRGQRLSVASIPRGRISMGTASTKATAGVADRVYEKIAQLALDGTLAQIASGWGLFSPYQTGQMKAMVDARRRADLTTWGCAIGLLVLLAFYLQNLNIQRARRNAEKAHAEAEQSRAQLFHQANHDVLTGLANRRLFNRTLSAELEKSGRMGLSAALLCFDLDGFKAVNDNIGHEAGDNLLIEVATRLRGEFAGDTLSLSRMGGDEFAVIAGSVARESEPTVIAHRLLEVLQRPFELGGRTVRVGASIGVSLFPRDGTDAQILSRKADAAMYEAKRLGKNIVKFFHPSMEAGIDSKFSFELAMRGRDG